MSDYPDYTTGVSITAVAIDSLPIDIVARSIGSLSIDVLGEITEKVTIHISTIEAGVRFDVDIKDAAGVTFDVDISDATGVTFVVTPEAAAEFKIYPKTGVTFEVDITDATGVTFDVDISDATGVTFVITPEAAAEFKIYPKAGVTFDVDAAAGAIFDIQAAAGATFNVLADAGYFYIRTEALQELRVDIIDAAGVTFDVDITDATGVTFEVDIVDATGVTFDVQAVDGYFYIRTEALQELRVDIIDASGVTFAVDITDATGVTFDVDISDATGVIFNVQAQAATGIKVDIETQTVDLNIKTSGETNIVIDLLKQSAFLEDRRILDNNGVTPSWAAGYTGNNRIGKVFPRGARGFIDAIDVYCRDAAAAGGTITVYISPYIGAGYLYSAVITVPGSGAAAWRTADFNVFWNYDSMFIFILCSSADMEFGYDSGGVDNYTSADAGATWAPAGNRSWFKAHLTGQTIGDLNIAGIINNIRIPNTIGNLTQFHPTDVDGGTTEDILALVYGVGELTMLQGAFKEVLGAVTPVFMILGIVIDGTAFEITMQQMLLSVDSQTKTVSPVSMGEVDAANDYYQFAFNVRIPFKQSLHIYAKNTAGAGNKFSCHGILAYEKLA